MFTPREKEAMEIKTIKKNKDNKEEPRKQSLIEKNIKN